MPHLLLVRVGVAVVAVVLVDMLVRVLKVTHHLPLLEQVILQQLVVVVLLELVMVATAQQVVLHKAVVVVLVEARSKLETEEMVAQQVVAVAAVVEVQHRLHLAQVQVAQVGTHKSRYGCSDEMA